MRSVLTILGYMRMVKSKEGNMGDITTSEIDKCRVIEVFNPLSASVALI